MKQPKIDCLCVVDCAMMLIFPTDELEKLPDSLTHALRTCIALILSSHANTFEESCNLLLSCLPSLKDAASKMKELPKLVPVTDVVQHFIIPMRSVVDQEQMVMIKDVNNNVVTTLGAVKQKTINQFN